MNPKADPVDELLERDGERWRSAFSPPPLAGMLAVATTSPRHRTRWVWPLVAAVVLLVIPLATVLAVQHRPHRSPAPSASHSAGLLGTVDWSDAVLQADGRTITIAVDINRTPNFCLDYGLPTTRAVVSETATTVSITAQVFRPSHPSPTPSVPPGSVLGCSAVGHQALPLDVQLRQPLGSRTLIDTTTGSHHPVLRASTLAKPSYLPSGYVRQSVQWHEETPHSQVLQDYTGPAGTFLVVRHYGFNAEQYKPVLATGTVLGYPAKVIGNSSRPSERCVLWNDPEYFWSLCSMPNLGSTPLDAAELLRIGNSMR